MFLDVIESVIRNKGAVGAISHLYQLIVELTEDLRQLRTQVETPKPQHDTYVPSEYPAPQGIIVPADPDAEKKEY